MDNLPEPHDEPVEALLDWHYRADAGLARLRTRLRTEARRPATVLRFTRRFAAVAALLLVTWGLVGGLSPPGERTEDSSDLVASLQLATGVPEHVVVRHVGNDKAVPAPGVAEQTLKTFSLDEESRTLHLSRDGRLPPGPRVDLVLEVRNRGRRPVVLKVGDERTLLRLDLRGPGTRTLFGNSVTAGQTPAFLSKRSVHLEPGASYFLPIPHLIGGRAGQLQAVYWTKPGRYTLAALYRVTVVDGGTERELYVRGSEIFLNIRPR